MNRHSIGSLAEDGGIASIDTGRPDDLYLTCASYEDRSLAAQLFLQDRYTANLGVVYAHEEFVADTKGDRTRGCLYRLVDHLARRCEKVSVIEGKWLDIAEQVTALRRPLSEYERNDAGVVTITIDATSFNTEALITIVKLARSQFTSSNVRILYASPRYYGVWLSQGSRFVRNIVGFSGITTPGRSTALVILSGFERERMLRVIEEHEPGVIYLGFGSPPTQPVFLDRNWQTQHVLLSHSNVERFEFSATDIVECAAKVNEIVAPLCQTHNVVIAPMSTKLSSVACLLVAERHPEIQLTYCVPGAYNTTAYSTGFEDLFVQTLPNSA